MILGLDRHPYAACFVEIDEAVAQLSNGRLVVFNAHAFQPPPGALIFNLENVPGQVDPRRWEGHEVWDFSAANVARYPASVPVKHVPIGFHPSMVRFERAAPEERDIDVILCGSMNPRRQHIIDDLRALGLRTVVNTSTFGAGRDALLARSKVALNVRFYDDGVFPTLRAAHLIANRVPVLNEASPDMPDWCGAAVRYDEIVEGVAKMLKAPTLEPLADASLAHFKLHPLVLP